MQCASKQAIVVNERFPWGRIYVAGKTDYFEVLRTLGTVLILVIFKLEIAVGLSYYKEMLIKKHDFVGSLHPTHKLLPSASTFVSSPRNICGIDDGIRHLPHGRAVDAQCTFSYG
jgi:hypothetical protein